MAGGGTITQEAAGCAQDAGGMLVKLRVQHEAQQAGSTGRCASWSHVLVCVCVLVCVHVHVFVCTWRVGTPCSVPAAACCALHGQTDMATA